MIGAHTEAQRPLLDAYTAFDGLEFCLLRDELNNRGVAALHLLPVTEWEAATAPWKHGDCASFMDGCEMYNHGGWRVIATMPDEAISLVMFFSGEYNGEHLAGRMCCIGLDGYLGFEEILAHSFDAFVEEFTTDPAAFFERIGFGWDVSDAGGAHYGDPIGAYIADVRGHPSLARWPGQR